MTARPKTPDAPPPPPRPKPARPDPEELLGAPQIEAEFGIPRNTWWSYVTPRKLADDRVRPPVGPPHDAIVGATRAWKRVTVQRWLLARPGSGWRKGQLGEIRGQRAQPEPTTRPARRPAKAS